MSRFAAFAAALSLLVVGALAGAVGVHLFHSHRPRAAEPPPLLRGHVVHRLERHLQLTPEQSQELAAILRQARDEGEALRSDVEPRLRQILRTAMEDIDDILTPEQRRRFRRVQRAWARDMGLRDRRPAWRDRPPRERRFGTHDRGEHPSHHPPPTEEGGASPPPN